MAVAARLPHYLALMAMLLSGALSKPDSVLTARYLVAEVPQQEFTRVAFGSCSQTDQPQPMWVLIAASSHPHPQTRFHNPRSRSFLQQLEAVPVMEWEGREDTRQR